MGVDSIRTVEAHGTPARQTVRAFGLLTKAAFARDSRRRPLWLLLQQVIVPVAVVCFSTFIHASATTHGGWPMLAIAGAVWLLFANGVTQGGMTLWHERRLLDGSRTPPWLLVSAAAIVPICLFALHLALLELALAVDSAPYSTVTITLLLPAAIALAAGVGTGILAARLCGVHPRVRSALPALLAATFILTPVLYPLSALEGAGDAWCTVNPLCAAVELARADISDAPSPLPDYSVIAAVGSSAALLCWGFFVIRRRRPPLGQRPNEPALVLTGVSTGDADPRSRRRISSVSGALVEAVGLSGSGQLPKAGPPSLHDIHLTIGRGEIVAAVGAAGSGQAPLLRIAAGSSRPSAGRVEANGGTASLIDPRGGVHSALSGRANLLLRAYLDGLSPADARARADAVLEFTRLTDRADVPAFRYSDRECTQLAFGAMAASTARVLIWDDDLLLPDPEFRQACLARIPALLAEGRSIVMASQDVGKLEEISPRAVWLDDGRIRLDAPTGVVHERYLEPRVSPGPTDPPGAFRGPCRVAAVCLLDDHGEPATHYLPGDPITVALELETEGRIERPYLIVSIAGEYGPIAAASMYLDGHRPASLEGLARIECRFETPALAPRHAFTVRFAMYASDGFSILYPKRVIASFFTGGSAAACGFSDPRAEGWILGTAPVLPSYSWRLPGLPDRRLGPGVPAAEHGGSAG